VINNIVPVQRNNQSSLGVDYSLFKLINSLIPIERPRRVGGREHAASGSMTVVSSLDHAVTGVA